ncbi:hypothetical protein GGS23DRAFT_285577 [Durotheca rogersii]|uniref:uncharacterized protein n=1 Tax=Durotheca rogersii TaxID=419775 RepID=UPI00221F1EAF|nr:uncharacterized protein GGS23DRAFT_285577 [Durotheca rogersii]KAI5866746.1 hypothetical protein GGS23DRAFT_285577 [Durotheca rogersii]
MTARERIIGSLIIVGHHGTGNLTRLKSHTELYGRQRVQGANTARAQLGMLSSKSFSVSFLRLPSVITRSEPYRHPLLADRGDPICSVMICSGMRQFASTFPPRVLTDEAHLSHDDMGRRTMLVNCFSANAIPLNRTAIATGRPSGVGFGRKTAAHRQGRDKEQIRGGMAMTYRKAIPMLRGGRKLGEIPSDHRTTLISDRNQGISGGGGGVIST